MAKTNSNKEFKKLWMVKNFVQVALVALLGYMTYSCSRSHIAKNVMRERSIQDTIHLNTNVAAFDVSFETDKATFFFNSNEILSFFESKVSLTCTEDSNNVSPDSPRDTVCDYKKILDYLIDNGEWSFKSVSIIDSLKWEDKGPNEVHVLRQEFQAIDFLVMFEFEMCSMIDSLEVAVEFEGELLKNLQKILNSETFSGAGRNYYTYETDRGKVVMECREFFRYN